MKVDKLGGTMAIRREVGGPIIAQVIGDGPEQEELARVMAQAEEMRRLLTVLEKYMSNGHISALIVAAGCGDGEIKREELRSLLAACEPPKPLSPADKLANAVLFHLEEDNDGDILWSAYRDYEASKEAKR